MIKMEYVEGRTIKTKEINFTEAIEIIKEVLKGNYEQVKTIFEIPSYKGLGLHQVAIWYKEKLSIDMYNNNLVITDGNNSIAINSNVDSIIRNRKNMQNTFDIYFNDYNMSFMIKY